MSQVFLRRAAAVAMLIALCMVVLFGLIAPTLTSFIENRRAILLARERLDQMGVRLIDPESLTVHRAALEAIPAEKAGLLKVSTEGEIALRLENHLRTLLQSRGAEMSLMRPVAAPGEDEGVRIVRASVSLQIPQNQVLQVIVALEAGSPAIFFETARLRHSDRRQGSQNSGTLELSGTIRVYLDRPQAPERRP